MCFNVNVKLIRTDTPSFFLVDIICLTAYRDKRTLLIKLKAISYCNVTSSRENDLLMRLDNHMNSFSLVGNMTFCNVIRYHFLEKIIFATYLIALITQLCNSFTRLRLSACEDIIVFRLLCVKKLMSNASA